ncbi:putative homodimeric type [Phaeomoniella chlamydospora]|uniref:dihydroorotase n=1 Tax=Phaeomoniella chlamydospora TaxID=158046 RepID=A0A0G2EQK7_PHACM|nr:putative homodimeric type [Phaeomoniella chlamydospora]
MSLYLHPSITPEVIVEAKEAGIRGVKSYPAGVTTNSAAGVVDYVQFYPVFSEMEKQGLVLNLHGECPPADDISVMNAEERFLPTLLDLHRRFPNLRIILEHCTTEAAIKAVQSCGPTVAATLTAHHLFLTISDVVGQPLNFCKPVAKLPEDRLALVKAAASGNPKFFLGTDSAPHPLAAKTGGHDHRAPCAAGVFTQPYAVQLVLEAFDIAITKGVLSEDQVTVEILRNFLSIHGREFYGEPESKGTITIEDKSEIVVDLLSNGSESSTVVPFRANEKTLSIRWN